MFTLWSDDENWSVYEWALTQESLALRLWNFFHAQLNWARNFNCSEKLKYRQIKKFLALSLPEIFIYHANKC